MGGAEIAGVAFLIGIIIMAVQHLKGNKKDGASK